MEFVSYGEIRNLDPFHVASKEGQSRIYGMRDDTTVACDLNQPPAITCIDFGFKYSIITDAGFHPDTSFFEIDDNIVALCDRKDRPEVQYTVPGGITIYEDFWLEPSQIIPDDELSAYEVRRKVLEERNLPSGQIHILLTLHHASQMAYVLLGEATNAVIDTMEIPATILEAETEHPAENPDDTIEPGHQEEIFPRASKAEITDRFMLLDDLQMLAIGRVMAPRAFERTSALRKAGQNPDTTGSLGRQRWMDSYRKFLGAYLDAQDKPEAELSSMAKFLKKYMLYPQGMMLMGQPLAEGKPLDPDRFLLSRTRRSKTDFNNEG